jgi:RecA-family ATPase
VLDLCLAVAGGRETLGDVRPSQGDAIYLALEDNRRRLQRRVDKLLGAFAETWPSRLTLSTDWRRMNEGGIDDLRDWCDSVQEPRLIVIDTLAKVRPTIIGKGGPTYDDDYRSIGDLHRLAKDRGIAIVLIHHVRKMDAEDPIDTVSGTLGLTGAADTVLVLDRRSDTGMTLYGRGRDIEEIETAIEFGRQTCRWTVRGEASDIRRSDERGRIIKALDDADEPLSPSEVALVTGMSKLNVRQLLFKMTKAGEVEKAGRGKYSLPSGTGGKADNIDNNITEGKFVA